MRTIKKVSERQQRIEKAYKAALIDQVDFVGALNWLNHYDKSIKDGKEFEGTREAFYEALSTAIPMLSELDIDQGEIEAVVSIKGKTPERHHYSYMSDGIKAMINIVSEIAYRCIELNGFLGKDSVRMGMPQLIRSKRFNEMVTLAKDYFAAVDTNNPSADDIKARLDELQINNSNDPGYIALMTYKSKKK